ncbi:MAG: hypothetical protein J2P46_10600 [Zavarzinella sp.]|nr:hypothetical protein [Zavarzinella sp.]
MAFARPRRAGRRACPAARTRARLRLEPLADRDTPAVSVLDLGTLPGATFSKALAVNDAGQVLGVAGPDNSLLHQRAVLWAPGAAEPADLGGKIGGGADFGGAVKDLNNRGEVVGWGNSFPQGTGYIWSAALGTKELPDLDPGDFNGGEFEPYGITDDGQIVGTTIRVNFDTGTSTEVSVTGSRTTIQEISTDFLAVGKVNAGGQIVGRTAAGAAALWDNGTITLLPAAFAVPDPTNPSTSTDEIQLGLNDAGEVVGRSADGHALYWSAARGLIDLNTLLPADSGWVLEAAADINNHEQIVGTGVHNGQQRAFLLTPEANVVSFQEAAPAESGASVPDTLAVTYQVDQELPSARLKFVASADPAFDQQDQPLGGLTLTADFLAENSRIYTPVGEAPADALKPGPHTLLIRPGAAIYPKLAAALANARVNYVVIVSGDGGTPDTEVAFAGAFQSRPRTDLVVRGSGGADVIDVSSSGSAADVSAQIGGTTDEWHGLDLTGHKVVVLAGDGDDVVYAGDAHVPIDMDGGAGNDSLTGGSGNDTMAGGPGGDTYLFDAGAAGLKRINERESDGDPADRDVLDFGNRDAGIRVDLSNATSRQRVGGALQLKLADANGIEDVVGTGFDDWIAGNDRDNHLDGHPGNDVLYGGNGDDTLTGDDGNDGLYGGDGDDRLSGGPGADRFLNRNGVDEAQDYAPDDARINFADGSVPWKEAEVRRIDEALGWLQWRTGDTRLLKQRDGTELTLRRVAAFPQGARYGAKNVGGGLIEFANTAFSTEAFALRSAFHEIGHNWDSDLNGHPLAGFEVLSGWEQRDVADPLPTGYKWAPSRPRTGSWWAYQTTARFAYSPGGTYNPFEDFATSFETYFLILEKRDGDLQQAAAVGLKQPWHAKWSFIDGFSFL